MKNQKEYKQLIPLIHMKRGGKNEVDWAMILLWIIAGLTFVLLLKLLLS